jgi:DNA-binding XRE family transcriptional regulator
MPSRKIRNRSLSGTETDRLVFAAKVRAGRAVLGWSQTELGKRIGVAQRTIHLIEKAMTTARRRTQEEIDKAFRDAGLVFRSSKNGGLNLSVEFAVIVRNAPGSPAPKSR